MLIALKDERDRTKRESRRAFQSLADLYVERGRALVHGGHSSRGLLWLARALANAPPDDSARQVAIRLNLSVQELQLHQLKGFFLCDGDRAAFSPDRRILITGDFEEARLWNTTDGSPLRKPILHEGQAFVTGVAFSSDGKTFITVGQRGKAQLWNTADGSARGQPMILQKSVHAVSFSPDGKTVISGSWDRTASLWSAADG